MKLFFLRLVPRKPRTIFIALVSWWSFRSIWMRTPRFLAPIRARATGTRSKEYSAIRMMAPLRVLLIAWSTCRSIRSREFQLPRGLLK